MSDSCDARILAVLQRLQVLPEKAETLEHEASRLALVFGLYRTQDAPGRRQAGRAKASKEMIALANDFISACNRIYQLPAEARNAYAGQLELAAKKRADNEARGIFQRFDNVRQLDALTVELLASANALVEAEATLGPSDSKKPSKRAASHVTAYAYDVYERLTGSLPTVRTKDGKAYGPFFDFVAGLFAALEINASAENQARHTIKEKRSRI